MVHFDEKIYIPQGETPLKIRIGIAGYGNLGKGVECALTKTDDMELVGVFNRVKTEIVAEVIVVVNAVNGLCLGVEFLGGNPFVGFSLVIESQHTKGFVDTID